MKEAQRRVSTVTRSLQSVNGNYLSRASSHSQVEASFLTVVSVVMIVLFILMSTLEGRLEGHVSVK